MEVGESEWEEGGGGGRGMVKSRNRSLLCSRLATLDPFRCNYSLHAGDGNILTNTARRRAFSKDRQKKVVKPLRFRHLFIPQWVKHSSSEPCFRPPPTPLLLTESSAVSH